MSRGFVKPFVRTAGSLAALCSFLPSLANAEPIRLRADALAEARSPTGLLIMQGEDHERPWLDAEALVWGGARTDATGDVLVLQLRLKEPHGWGEVRGGRFVFTTGAIRPMQIDGASGLARAPWGTTVEAFGGAPVAPRFGERPYTFVAGGRVSQSILSRATVGVSYVEQRDGADVAGQELGADLAAVPVSWLDLAGRAAYDVISPGIAEAHASAAARSRDVRVELFASHRSPGRLLPATSLFSVLGDFPSQLVGTTVRWAAAPRLDVLASAAGQSVGGDLGMNAWVRGNLRLDDQGRGTVGLEVRRQDVSTAKWTGVRAVASQALPYDLRYSTELEIAVPDDASARAPFWPWGLMALSWRSKSGWEVAAAVEASSTPQHLYEMDALARVSRSLEVTP